MANLHPRYGLGLERGVNRLVAHNPLWSQAFAEEASRIKSVLGDLALAIEHYGSTSVPDIRAKPIIDLQIGVADIRHGLDFIAPLERIGYDYADDQGIPEHHVFGRESREPILRTSSYSAAINGPERCASAIAFAPILLSAAPMKT